MVISKTFYFDSDLNPRVYDNSFILASNGWWVKLLNG
jgi:hypothetical protein